MSPQQRREQSTARYLCMILRLECQEGCVRVKSLARELCLCKGSVSGALKHLKARGLVDYRPYQSIHLTVNGREIAESIAERHRVIACFLGQVLQMPPEDSEKAAARMGPAVDKAVVARMRHYLGRALHEAL